MKRWMNIFGNKSLNNVAKKGARWLDSEIAMAVSKHGTFDHTMVTYHGTYLRILEQDQKEFRLWATSILPFIKGYCFMKELAALPVEGQHTEFLAAAVQFFGEFIEKNGLKSELGFVAAWKAVTMEMRLDLSWAEAEERLLAVTEAHPERGEALKEIIEHYISLEDYKIAHIYSSYCRNEFWGKFPRRENKWEVDLSFYQWRVLEYHFACCQVLQKGNQAEADYKLLREVLIKSPHLFSTEDMKRMSLYHRWFEREVLNPAADSYIKILQQ